MDGIKVSPEAQLIINYALEMYELADSLALTKFKRIELKHSIKTIAEITVSSAMFADKDTEEDDGCL